MSKSSFIITVAEIYIKIDISKISEPDIRKIIQKQITTYYRLELVPDYPKKIHYTIYYLAEEDFQFVKQQRQNESGLHYFLHTFTFEEDKAYINYHTSIAQFQFFLKMIIQSLLATHHGFILHASSISDGTFTYLFLGPNGIGKSTIVANLSKSYIPYSDDMVVVRKINNEWQAFQLPLEKKIFKKDRLTHIPIRALCYLEQHKKSSLQKIAQADAGKRLMDQLIGQGATNQHVQNLLLFLSEVDHYILKTPKNTDASLIEELSSFYQ